MWVERVILLACSATLISIASGQNCLVCDSRADVNCATLRDDGSLIEACPEGLQHCFTQMDENGHIQRGCGQADHCESVDHCTVCQGTSCNNGIYPAGRLQCHKCSGTDCGNGNIGSSEVCSIYQSDDFCYTIVENSDDLLTHRGCQSDVENNMCDEHPDFCVLCTGNGCNNQPPSGTTTLSCIQCNEPDPACRYQYEEENGQHCGYEILLGRPERCYTHVDSDGRVTRGCLDDFRTLPQIISDCDGTKDFCETCTENNCNLAQVADPGRCVVCDSATDTTCRLLTSTPNSIECPTGTHDKRGCYRMEANGQVSRGCVSSLTDDGVQLCQTGRDCKTCLESDCNRQVNFQSCYTCNSNEDQECIMDQDDEEPTLCTKYVENCVTYIDPDSRRTIRGCQGELILPTGVTCPSDMCSECSDETCNAGVFPTNRRSCNRCYATPDCANDLSANLALESVCEFYNSDDHCFSVLVQDNIHRGCLSDGSPGVQHCIEAGDKCLVCSGQNCNSVPAYREASLHCVKCSHDDPACEWAYGSNSGTKCEGTVGLGEDESCYILQTDDGIVRGCALEDPQICDSSESDCEFCGSGGCNNKAMTRQVCYQCRSDREGEETCAQQAEGLNATVCEAIDTTYDARGCYIEKLDDGTVRRGCASELAADQLEECKGDGEDKACHYCDGPGCNDEPGASSTIVISSLLIILLALTLVLIR
ncbi:hypothetical protein DMENIID0001_060680 [Sergentomyia squamirostris]